VNSKKPNLYFVEAWSIDEDEVAIFLPNKVVSQIV
jgi:hypothetical protein